MTADLVQFLRARLDEDEEAARLIAPGGYEPDEWRTEPSKSDRWAHVVAYSRTLGEPPEAASRESDQPVAMVQSGRNEALHIARHDPARVLVEVVAKRQIVEEYERAEEAARTAWKQGTVDLAGARAKARALKSVALRLALSYANHPDYREEWKP